jgi:hypothetical protein
MAAEAQRIAVGLGTSHEARGWKIAYWVATLLVVAQLVFSGPMLIARPPGVMDLVRHLGYPDYFPVLLGSAKLLGAFALVQPWVATLKEWAYAGVTFDLMAASLSHIASHDPAQAAIVPLVVVGLVAISYVADRRRN